MERPLQLKLRTVSLVLAGTGLCFLAGWTLAAPRSPLKGSVPMAKQKEDPRDAAARNPAGESGTGNFLLRGGTFAAMVAMDAEAAGLKPEDWPRLWRERMRTREHNGLILPWVKADPRGALKAALAAADDLSLSDQEGYDFQYLGQSAIMELFSLDLPSALTAMRNWREKYDTYPNLDCLHLLVSGDAAQKAALVELLRQEGAEKVRFGKTGKPLEVLDVLNQPGMPARPDLQQQIVYEAIQSRPGETVDWILKQAGPMIPVMADSALNSLRSAEGSPREITEAMERLLAAAPPDTVDGYAEEFALRKAAYDPAGARRWAEEHVPEARRKQVLEMLAK